MGTEVQFELEPAAPQAERAPEPSPGPQPATSFAPPVGRIAAAGDELMRALAEPEAEAEQPAPGPGVLVGRADDPAEAEADAVAKDVVRALRGGPLPSAAVAPVGGAVSRRSSGADPLGGTEVGGGLHDVLARRSGGGSALPAPVAESMGAVMGADFSGVRIHDDGEADTVARSLQAQAFTHGSDIYFSSGRYDPASSSGQELLAHELTHVVQQGGPGVSRKMWSVPDFEAATYESWHTAQSTAQKVVMKLLAEYGTAFEAHGVVLPADAPKAIAKIDEMRASAQWWISDHQVVDRKTKELKDDPNREKRMAGFRRFLAFLDQEKASLADSAAKTTAESGPPLEVAAPSPGFLKLQQKYEGNAKSFFEKIGDLAERAVPDNGDASELEAEVSFPIDPSGVGYIGGKFTAAIEKDDQLVKMKASLSVTGGADVDVAKVGGELGGYLESQANSGADCMSLVSYAMYRRFRESHVLPNEAANFLWGGQKGSYGFDKAEAWSLALEKRLFEVETPVLSDFVDLYPTMPEAKAAYDEALAEAEERKQAIYVETGGVAGASVEGDIGVVKGKAAVQGTEGRRVDFQSLQNRKGGAGKDNRGSDSVLAGVARGLTDGRRGAQKRTGRSVRSLMVMGSVEGTAGVVSLGGSATLQLKWSNDGVSSNAALNPTKKASVTSLDSATLELAGTAGIALGDLAGDAAGQWVEFLQGKVEDFVKEKAQPAATKQQQADPESGPEADEGIADLLELNAMALGVPQLQEDLQDQLAEMAGAETESADSYKLAVTFDMVKKSIAFELRKVGETGIELPKSISVKKTSSSRLCRFTWAGGAWKKG